MREKEKPHASRVTTSDTEIKVSRTGAAEMKAQERKRQPLEDRLASPLTSGWDAPAQTYVLLSEATAIMPDDQLLLIKRGQWQRLRRRVTEFGSATNDWSTAAWAFVGIAVAALLAIFAPSKVVLVAAAASGALAAALCFAIGRQLHIARKSEGFDIVNEMDTIVGGQEHR